MSRLEELIQELCPDGVEYKKIKDVAKLLRGKRLTKNMLSEDGQYPVYHGGLDPLGYYTEKNREANTVMIINVGASAGTVGFSDADFWSSDGCYCISHNKYTLPKFIYVALSCKESLLMSKVRKAGIPTLDAKVIENIEIPVPPLPVQEEIVKILDKFTDYVTELQAELQARKQQYEYYLDCYFENSSYEKVRLDSLGTLTRGKRFVHADATVEGVPCVHYGEMYTYYGTHVKSVKSHIREDLRLKMRYANPGDVIIVGAGENNVDIGIGLSWEGKEPVAVHDACYILKHNQNSRYISYYLRSSMYHNQIKRWVSEGKICSISAQNLGKTLIPVPPIEEQINIANILSRFEELCYGIESGLPAEIEARQKQYEYYRDKLLSFKKKEV